MKKSNLKGYFFNVSSLEENLNFKKFSPFSIKSKLLSLAKPCLVVIVYSLPLYSYLLSLNPPTNGNKTGDVFAQNSSLFHKNSSPSIVNDLISAPFSKICATLAPFFNITMPTLLLL